jgi:hypothetical protein
MDTTDKNKIRRRFKVWLEKQKNHPSKKSLSFINNNNF